MYKHKADMKVVTGYKYSMLSWYISSSKALLPNRSITFQIAPPTVEQVIKNMNTIEDMFAACCV